MAAVLYVVFWAIDRRNSGGPSGTSRPVPRGPIGPDDDENFLRNLDRERRRTSQDPPNTSQENHDQPE